MELQRVVARPGKSPSPAPPHGRGSGQGGRRGPSVCELHPGSCTRPSVASPEYGKLPATSALSEFLASPHPAPDRCSAAYADPCPPPDPAS